MKITNKHSLPAPLYDTIVRAVEMYEGPSIATLAQTKRISVTTLLNPPRLTFLRAQHDASMEVDAASLLYLVMGISFHHLMAEFSSSSGLAVVERRADRTFGGWTISGQFDSLADGTLSDWKFTSVWAILLGRDEWATQLNLYRWLDPTLEVEGLETWALLRDWSAAKAARDKRMPPIAFTRVQRPIWAESQVEALLTERLALYDSALSLFSATHDGNAVPVCTPEERWERGKTGPARCKSYCDVAAFCAYGCTFKQNEEGVAE